MRRNLLYSLDTRADRFISPFQLVPLLDQEARSSSVHGGEGPQPVSNTQFVDLNLSERCSLLSADAFCLSFLSFTLVYGFTWEDPKEDMKALNLTKDDSMLVITSGSSFLSSRLRFRELTSYHYYHYYSRGQRTTLRHRWRTQEDSCR